MPVITLERSGGFIRQTEDNSKLANLCLGDMQSEDKCIQLHEMFSDALRALLLD